MKTIRNRTLAMIIIGTLLISLLGSANITFADAAAPKEEITLQMLSMPSNMSGLQEGWWANYLLKELGIKIELLPSGDQGEQKLQALMAAASLPDMVVFKDAKQVLDAQRAKLLVAFDDYADKMPNAQKYTSVAMKYYAAAASTDGKCYSIPNDIGPANIGTDLNWSVSLRWDLYKKLGMPKLETYMDYLPLLKQMQDLEPTNADGQKVYGISMWSDWDSYTMHQAMQPSVLNGIDSGDQIGAKLPFAAVNFTTMEMSSILAPDSEYIKGLRFLYEANQMGIVDPDSMTQRFDTALEKANNGRILFGWWSWAVGGYNTPERTDVDDFKGFATIIPENYKAFMSTMQPVGKSWSWSVSSSGKYIDRCIEYVDFMCNPEKVWTLANGPQGEIWDMNAEGKPYITEKGYALLSDPTAQLQEGGKLSDGLSVINSTPITLATVNDVYGEKIANSKWATYEAKTTKLQADWAATMGYKNSVDRCMALNSYTPMPLAISFIDPLADDIQMMVQQIGDVVKTDSWLIVFAKDDTEYNQLLSEMIEKANGLGIDQVMEYNKTAWTAAMEKAKLYE